MDVFCVCFYSVGWGVLSTPGVHSIDAASKNLNISLGILNSEKLLNSLSATINSSDFSSYHLIAMACPQELEFNLICTYMLLLYIYFYHWKVL